MPPASANLRWRAKFRFLKGFVFEFEFLPSHLLLLQLWLNLIFKICKIWYGPVCAVISRYSFPGSCVGIIFDIYALFDDIHRAFYNSFVCFVCAYMIIIKPVYRIIIKPVHRIIMKPVHMIIIKPVHIWLSSNLCIGVGAHDQTLCITCGHCNP